MQNDKDPALAMAEYLESISKNIERIANALEPNVVDDDRCLADYLSQIADALYRVAIDGQEESIAKVLNQIRVVAEQRIDIEKGT
jgi:hypothetical protein